MSFEDSVLGADTLRLLGEEPAFRTFTIGDRNPLSGRKRGRRIYAPNRAMKLIHSRFIRYLRSLDVSMPHATACRPGDSSRKNAEYHRGNRYLYLLDLSHAFESVHAVRLARDILYSDPNHEVGWYRQIQAFLRDYCMLPRKGLITGAPASPDLFNLYCAAGDLDGFVGYICRQNGITYTRYLDDLTFSSRNPIVKGVRIQIRNRILTAGFEINDRKAKLCDLARGAVEINGIGLELSGRIFVPSRFRDHIRGLLFLGLQGDFSLLPKIHGAMSVFFGIVDRSTRTKGERRIIRDYKRLCRLVKDGEMNNTTSGLA